ncbi:MAG: hypothetical protein IGS49_18795 [Chlorogloeopsis fritschii C42_A2020_084]|uniref:conotoxin n=1 Tax=Chlorogloeopsis fritschii TaxID=1124 RepID=UPI0019DB1480|nr:conotoxin [Chlorogloeopsis fritschii]MBF2007448.1 hypothetical protein [Chlorogloeopsis fritschii C42_A2020_084]
MELTTVLLVIVLFFTPATALARQTQPSDRLSVTNRQKLDQNRKKLNADIERIVKETQELERFSRPYLVEFQRRNEQMQHRPDAVIRFREN